MILCYFFVCFNCELQHIIGINLKKITQNGLLKTKIKYHHAIPPVAIAVSYPDDAILVTP